jgi:hypothetical protein
VAKPVVVWGIWPVDADRHAGNTTLLELVDGLAVSRGVALGVMLVRSPAATLC